MFVAVVRRMDAATWLDCHVRAFAFLGAVPSRSILDNLKSGVLHPDLYDPLLKRGYAELARHFGCLIDPARAAKPKDKDHAAYCTSFNRSVCKSRAWRLANRNPLRGSGPDLTSIIECLVLATDQTLCAEPDRARPRRHAADVCQRRSCACIGGSPSRSRTSTDRGQDQRVGNGGSQVCHSGRIADGR
jgi:hypothetical protein